MTSRTQMVCPSFQHSLAKFTVKLAHFSSQLGQAMLQFRPSPTQLQPMRQTFPISFLMVKVKSATYTGLSVRPGS